MCVMFFFAELNISDMLSCSEDCKLQHMLEHEKWHSVVLQYLPDHLTCPSKLERPLRVSLKTNFPVLNLADPLREERSVSSQTRFWHQSQPQESNN